MARNNSYFLLSFRGEFKDERSYSYDVGDETFHVMKHDKGDFMTFQHFESAACEVYRMVPDENALLEKFNDLVSLNEDKIEALRKDFYPFLEIQRFEIETSPLKFKAPQRLCSFDVTEEEYNLVIKSSKNLFYKEAGDFLVEYNGKHFVGIVDEDAKFEWGQIRSNYHREAICIPDMYIRENASKELEDLLDDMVYSALHPED